MFRGDYSVKLQTSPTPEDGPLCSQEVSRQLCFSSLGDLVPSPLQEGSASSGQRRFNSIFQANPPCVRKHFDPTEGMHLFAQGNTGQETLTGSLWPQAHNNQMPRGQFKRGPARKQEDLKKPSSLFGPYHFF